MQCPQCQQDLHRRWRVSLPHLSIGVRGPREPAAPFGVAPELPRIWPASGTASYPTFFRIQKSKGMDHGKPEPHWRA
jgi:hypothetical protein